MRDTKRTNPNILEREPESLNETGSYGYSNGHPGEIGELDAGRSIDPMVIGVRRAGVEGLRKVAMLLCNMLSI